MRAFPAFPLWKGFFIFITLIFQEVLWLDSAMIMASKRKTITFNKILQLIAEYQYVQYRFLGKPYE